MPGTSKGTEKKRSQERHGKQREDLLEAYLFDGEADYEDRPAHYSEPAVH